MLIGHTFRQDFESVCICGVESERDGKRVARRQDPQASLCAGEVLSQCMCTGEEAPIDGQSTCSVRLRSQKSHRASKPLKTLSKQNLLQVWRDFKPVLARIWAELYDAYLDTRFLKQSSDDADVCFRDLYKIGSPPGKW